jgi:NAD(P)-dependent dehydrogenase (short-subunit alcohol dehydrogenase family)
MTTEDEARGVALVTGAASGIGAAVAARLSADSWTVAGLDLAAVDGVALALQGDVADREVVESAVQRVADELGPIELLVTAAGVYEQEDFSAIDEARWRRMLSVHLGGTMHACAAVVGSMRERGSGCIITISSELGLAGGDREAHYAAAKGAVLGFTRSLGAEMALHGVRVVGVAPGPTDTPLLDEDSPWREDDYLSTLPLRRLVRPQEVADTVAFLATEGTYFAGQVVSPNAGKVI